MKNKIIIIGAGGVARVIAHKCAALPEIFGDIVIASRRRHKCEQLAASLPVAVAVAAVNADSVAELCQLFNYQRPRLVINAALPYQDLTIMEACLRCGCHYLDTANYESPDNPKFEYRWQWDYQQRFEDAGLMALLGSGFDPGVTNVFTAYAAKHYFAELHELKIIDVNGGSHGLPFATNFNPEINIREITAPCRHWQDGRFHQSAALSTREHFVCPQGVGSYNIYRLYHEELESLTKFFPTLHRAEFWMSFSDDYLNYLRVIENLGLSGIKPIEFQGSSIVPLQFLQALLPDPATLAGRTVGKTCIGVQLRGAARQGGSAPEMSGCYIYNVCDHQQCFHETGSQAVSYTTGVPAMIGAKLMLEGQWFQPGVFNLEQLDPDPFMADLKLYGLPWQVSKLDDGG